MLTSEPVTAKPLCLAGVMPRWLRQRHSCIVSLRTDRVSISLAWPTLRGRKPDSSFWQLQHRFQAKGVAPPSGRRPVEVRKWDECRRSAEGAVRATFTVRDQYDVWSRLAEVAINPVHAGVAGRGLRLMSPRAALIVG